MIKISTSILQANFANLNHEIKALELAGTDMLHIDVMDGVFVPNLSFGPLVIKSLRVNTNLTFDVHLMIDKPENSLNQYATAGADIITVHPETTIHLDRALTDIQSFGLKAGLALLPSTCPSIIDYVIDKIDLILVMSVNPGFGGQSFIPSQLNKIKILADKIKASHRDIILSVDGGINNHTASKAVEAGANLLVAGSYILGSKDYKKSIDSLKIFGGN